MALSCPHCGRELLADGAIRKGRWRLSPGMAELDDIKLGLSAGEASVLYTLAAAAGDIVTPRAIGAGYGSIDETPDSVRVLIARVRRKLGATCPIETIRAQGYRWREPAGSRAENPDEAFPAG